MNIYTTYISERSNWLNNKLFKKWIYILGNI